MMFSHLDTGLIHFNLLEVGVTSSLRQAQN